MSADLCLRVAAAMFKTDWPTAEWKTHWKGGKPDDAAKRYIAMARTAILTMKYEDGTDEDSAIGVCAAERIDPVAFICAYDRYLDLALAKPIPVVPGGAR